MKPSETLISGLRAKGLLPADPAEIGGYLQLESAILTHVSSSGSAPSNVVWFDGECIENKGDYFGLLDEFIKAADCESEIANVQSEVDFEKGIATCSATRNGSLLEASWTQDSDWVTAEFLHFTARLLNSDQGEFVAIDTGDQTYCAVFLPATVLKSFTDFKTRDTNSRDGFFMQHGEAVKQRFGHIEILSVDDYQSVLRAFSEAFIEEGPVSEIGSYRKGKALEVVYASRWSDALDAFGLVKRNAPATDLYADLSPYETQLVCPDEGCHFLSFNPAYNQVIFAGEAQYIATIVGSFDVDRSAGEHLLVGKSGTWGVYVKEHSVICAGDPPMALARSVSKSIAGNENAKYLELFSGDHFGPRLESLGYERVVEQSRGLFAKDHGELRAAFSISGYQPEPHEPLEIVIRVGLFVPAIASMLGLEDPVPKSLVGYAMRFPEDSRANRWLIGSQDDYESLVGEMCAFIEEVATAVEDVGVDDELLEMYQHGDLLMHAAAVAIKMGNRDQAVALAQRAFDEAVKRGSLVGRTRELAGALGIELDEDAA